MEQPQELYINTAAALEPSSDVLQENAMLDAHMRQQLSPRRLITVSSSLRRAKGSICDSTACGAPDGRGGGSMGASREARRDRAIGAGLEARGGCAAAARRGPRGRCTA